MQTRRRRGPGEWGPESAKSGCPDSAKRGVGGKSEIEKERKKGLYE